jgi:hypothetical protein
MVSFEYALEETRLDTRKRRVMALSWTENIDEVRASLKRFVSLDKIPVSYGGKRQHHYRIVGRPKVEPGYLVIEEEA